MAKPLRIGNQLIGLDQKPLVVGELSGNHNGSLDRALQLVDLAASAGLDAIKLQTYTPETMTLKNNSADFTVVDKSSIWVGKSLYELYARAQTPWDWHEPIFERARAKGMLAFSSPFDSSAVDFLETLDVPCYKIASFELTDLPLITKASATGKPLIISTGMGTLEEITAAVETARKAGCSDLILLKCTSNYPASVSSSNLNGLPVLSRLFQTCVGLSDHTLGNCVATTSVGLGARMFEKHITLDSNDGAVDSVFSADKSSLDTYVKSIHEAYEALGVAEFGPTAEENSNLKFRRSIYIVEDIPLGGILTRENTKILRPCLGILPKFYDEVLGRKVNKAIASGTPLSWDHLN